MVPAKGVKGIDPKNPKGIINLASKKVQRGLQTDDNGLMSVTANDVVKIRAVAWRDETVPGDNPVQILRPHGDARDKFPVTRVLIEWTDRKST